jgi:hypothetical protein
MLKGNSSGAVNKALDYSMKLSFGQGFNCATKHRKKIIYIFTLMAEGISLQLASLI